MQKCPIYLYSNSFTVLLDLDNNTRINNVMYQRELQIQRGLKNKVQIQFKNSDQKFVNVSSGTYVFSMFDDINQRQVVTKPLEIIDAGTTSTRGLAQLTLSESDTLDLDLGKYKFTVAALDSDGSYTPTYANTYYGVSGTLELRQDSFPNLKPSVEVAGFGYSNGFQMIYNADMNYQQYEYYSGNLEAHPEFNGSTALHTMAFYLTRFKGVVHIEGTQVNSPGFFGDYVTLSTKTYNGFTGVDYANVNGVWSFLRVKYIPTKNPGSNDNGNNETTYRGTFDKLLYRH